MTRRRAERNQPYWTLMNVEDNRGHVILIVQKVIEKGDPFDDSRHASGNYYLTARTAKAHADARRKAERNAKNRKCKQKDYYETGRKARKKQRDERKGDREISGKKD